MLEVKNRKGLLELLKANPNEKEITLRIKPTNPLITLILSHTKTETLCCSPKIHAFFTQKTLSALEKVGVQVKTIETKMGRPAKHAEEKIKKIREMHEQGKKPEEIAGQLHMPLRTVYYHLNGK